MNEIYILYIIFGLLFLIEKKSINTLVNFIGLTITIAIIISLYKYDYISYILILVQISALTILFGFIIMLYPKNNTIIGPLIKQDPKKLYNKNSNILLYIFWISIIILMYIYIIIIKDNIKIEEFNKINLFSVIVDGGINNYFIPPHFLGGEEESITFKNKNGIENYLNIIFSNYNELLTKIGILLWTNDLNIIKLIIVTIILLLAIIALFFLLFPTL